MVRGALDDQCESEGFGTCGENVFSMVGWEYFVEFEYFLDDVDY